MLTIADHSNLPIEQDRNKVFVEHLMTASLRAIKGTDRSRSQLICTDQRIHRWKRASGEALNSYLI